MDDLGILGNLHIDFRFNHVPMFKHVFLNWMAGRFREQTQMRGKKTNNQRNDPLIFPLDGDSGEANPLRCALPHGDSPYHLTAGVN